MSVKKNGSKDTNCTANGKCECKNDYDGDKCSACANEYFKTSTESQNLCSGFSILLIFRWYCR